MEYLTGRDLGTVIADEGPLEPERAVSFIMQACQALEVAHQAGVIHRDIKPQNLFLVAVEGELDQIKLLDFGVVRFREPRGGDLTWTGMLVGTPLYLAPELWTGAPADERSDLYSMGLTLYFLLTGRLPFGESGNTSSGVGPGVMFANPSPAERELESLVGHCRAPDPAQRAVGAGAARALEALLPRLRS
jgi:serine/threonine-protein kinase